MSSHVDRGGQDLYQVLGVSRDASWYQVKQAYRAKAMKAHPDRGGSAGDFERLTRAYQVLMDPEARRAYDQTGVVQDRSGVQIEGVQVMIQVVCKILEEVGAEAATIDVIATAKARLNSASMEAAKARDKANQKATLIKAQAERLICKTSESPLAGALLANEQHAHSEAYAADRTRQVIQAALSGLEDYGWRMDVVEVDRQRAYLDQVSKAMMDDFYARAQGYVSGFGSKVTTA